MVDFQVRHVETIQVHLLESKLGGAVACAREEAKRPSLLDVAKPLALAKKSVDLVGGDWNMTGLSFHILGISSSQLTNIFQRGGLTTNQIICTVMIGMKQLLQL